MDPNCKTERGSPAIELAASPAVNDNDQYGTAVWEKLDKWIQEVKVQDAASCGEKAQKYLKFIEMIKETYVCQDIKKVDNANNTENKAFDKNGKDVIDRAMEAIKKIVGKTDLENTNHTFMNIKKKEPKTSKDLVNRF